MIHVLACCRFRSRTRFHSHSHYPWYGGSDGLSWKAWLIIIGIVLIIAGVRRLAGR
jgi:hypothetical protein